MVPESCSHPMLSAKARRTRRGHGRVYRGRGRHRGADDGHLARGGSLAHGNTAAIPRPLEGPAGRVARRSADGVRRTQEGESLAREQEVEALHKPRTRARRQISLRARWALRLRVTGRVPTPNTPPASSRILPSARDICFDTYKLTMQYSASLKGLTSRLMRCVVPRCVQLAENSLRDGGSL